MLLPRGRPVFEGMDCMVIALEKLIERQRASAFTGYLVLHGVGGDQAVQPFLRGEPQAGTYEAGETTHVGDEAFSRMRVLAAREGATADLHAADPEIVSLLTRYRPGKRLYAELEAQLVSPEKLFDLCAAKQLTGFLRVYQVRSRRRLGSQLLASGAISEAQLAQAVRAQLTGASGKSLLGNILVELGFITQEDVNRCLSQQMDGPPAPDQDLGWVVFVGGQRKTSEEESNRLLTTPGALVDIFSLKPAQAP